MGEVAGYEITAHLVLYKHGEKTPLFNANFSVDGSVAFGPGP